MGTEMFQQSRIVQQATSIPGLPGFEASKRTQISGSFVSKKTGKKHQLMAISIYLEKEKPMINQ
jgi:hypothetical protein